MGGCFIVDFSTVALKLVNPTRPGGGEITYIAVFGEFHQSLWTSLHARGLSIYIH
jgi:hypothetical protein